MATHLEAESRWPELFAPLSETERRMVFNSLGHRDDDDWQPGRSDAIRLIAAIRGIGRSPRNDAEANSGAFVN